MGFIVGLVWDFSLGLAFYFGFGLIVWVSAFSFCLSTGFGLRFGFGCRLRG